MEKNRVFFFAPNLVGYLRALLYLSAFIVHTFNFWQLSIILYTLGFLLDELDGRLAQQFDQKTQFGAALDMVLDRCATTGLCLILAQLYPRFLVIFIVLIALDISSHFYVVLATHLLAKSSHKDGNIWSKNWLVSLYYNQKAFFDALIAGNELFYILLYIQAYGISWQLLVLGIPLNLWQILLGIVFPLYSLKQLINIVQLVLAANQVALMDWQSRVSEKIN
ncbi:MAG: CDP-alcohol phosphatidyltransferase family protein [Jaaginema sp. PMC 1079.18]|nr:CDP-alcohol phosphatidyltransferase family protein [Jaaginema sp. PMC 1080.18]MEC4853492.1 CDP-alcohol phosphatidyltransferase family protein [Jaaginema sp. PMC 1079.18]MEC4867760.1 CDP-alcohol phosphatidyltransferase family protein [Jaaginema sp. PMC 1078.18]